MIENKYTELLNQLAADEIETLEVPNSEFFLFREAWMEREDRTKIVGEAQLHGNVVYRYEKEG